MPAILNLFILGMSGVFLSMIFLFFLIKLNERFVRFLINKNIVKSEKK